MEWLRVQKLTLGDCIPCLPNIREYDHEKLRKKYEQAKYVYAGTRMTNMAGIGQVLFFLHKSTKADKANDLKL